LFHRSLMRASSQSAIVLGASMSGLLAAKALSKHFQRVTVVERDLLPDRAMVRRGVPQSAHAHGLLASGYRVMDDYFPGMMDELEACGAPRGDVVGDVLWFQYGRWKLRHQSGLRGITVSRPCLEATVRRRVRALPNVAFLEGTSGVKPAFNASASRVEGLVVCRRDDNSKQMLQADLVVDASGRGSQSPKWLEEWGFGQPATISVKVDVGYATRVFERRAGDLFNSIGAIVAGTPPAETRYAAILAAEGSCWVITLIGMLGDYPPVEEGAWTRFAASLPVPVVHNLVTSARPLTEIVSYRFSANQRRLYERMKQFPKGIWLSAMHSVASTRFMVRACLWRRPKRRRSTNAWLREPRPSRSASTLVRGRLLIVPGSSLPARICAARRESEVVCKWERADLFTGTG
jgi:2-polyprenyl-6-methoxyphenol hydroxylase-like FAD-dependent oxidoreductase